jgi:hypothetical protein
MFSSQSSGAVNAAVNAVADVANGAANAATNAANAATNAANDLFKSVNTAANNAVNTVSQNIPLFNSLIPIGNSSSGPAANNTKAANNAANNTKGPNNAGNKPANNAGNKPANNAGNKPANNAANKPANNAVNNANKSTLDTSWLSPLYIFAAIVVIFLLIFSVFNEQITNGYEYIAASIKKSLGLNVNPDVLSSVNPVMAVPQVTVAPEAPQDETLKQEAVPPSTSFIERILPSSGEVFNVAQNKFTYYDAEPLCKALGAELATYEQVKDAWGNGADWCNYGWVKGQMAIYPTQRGTYDKLQAGPADQRGACGTVGINGGYFDNPEFKYGVNCYGEKPSQSAHDQQKLMSEGKAAKSPETLKVDKMVADFKEEASSLYVKPFNDVKWAAS